jgi:hypothetical protein
MRDPCGWVSSRAQMHVAGWRTVGTPQRSDHSRPTLYRRNQAEPETWEVAERREIDRYAEPIGTDTRVIDNSGSDSVPTNRRASQSCAMYRTADSARIVGVLALITPALIPSQLSGVRNRWHRQ